MPEVTPGPVDATAPRKAIRRHGIPAVSLIALIALIALAACSWRSGRRRGQRGGHARVDPEA